MNSVNLRKHRALDRIGIRSSVAERTCRTQWRILEGRAAARKAIKDVGARGFVEMRRLASMANRAKNARINSSGYSPAQWVIGRGYKLPWSLLDEKQSGELASPELPDHSPEFGRRISWLWAARRSFDNMDTSHCLRRGLFAGVRASAHTQGIVNGDLVYILRKVKRNKTDPRTALRHPSVAWSCNCGRQREEQRVPILSRTRNKSCTRMPPEGKRSRANELGYHDERQKCSKTRLSK